MSRSTSASNVRRSTTTACRSTSSFRSSSDIATHKRFANLDANEIVFIIQSPLLGFQVACIDPAGADQREQNFTLSDPVFEDLSEIGTGGIELTSINTWSR
jgi:hypothetical protein